MTLDELIRHLLAIQDEIEGSGALPVYAVTATSEDLVRGLRVEAHGIELWDEVDPS